MTADELAALPADALIYLPTGWDVTVWRPGGAVMGGNWYTLLYPPDENGVVRNRRPQYIEMVELLLMAQTSEAAAWRTNVENLQAKIDWIQHYKLTDDDKPA